MHSYFIYVICRPLKVIARRSENNAEFLKKIKKKTFLPTQTEIDG